MNNYFPKASLIAGAIYNINGILYFVKGPIKIENLEGKLEYGWDTNNLNNNCSYHLFTETEIQKNNYVIQEF